MGEAIGGFAAHSDRDRAQPGPDHRRGADADHRTGQVNGPAFVLGWLAGLGVQTGIAGGQQALACLVFAVIATIGVGIPVVIYFATGKRSEDVLGKLKDCMAPHNAAIMSVLCLIIGAKPIGDAIGALT
jgi:Sap, sulfolipid-1-addressing protein